MMHSSVKELNVLHDALKVLRENVEVCVRAGIIPEPHGAKNGRDLCDKADKALHILKRVIELR